MRQTAVVGSEERLTRCFRVFEVASEQHQKVAKTLKRFISRKGTKHNGYIIDE